MKPIYNAILMYMVGARALIGEVYVFIYSGYIQAARLVSPEVRLISKEVSRAEPEYMNTVYTPN